VKSLVNCAHGSGLTPASASTNYVPFATSLLGTSTSEPNRRFKHREAGTVRRARVYVSTNTATAGSVTLRKNTADTAVVVTLGALTTGWLEDITNSVAVADGDLLAWKIITGTGSTTMHSITAEFEPTDATAMISNLGCAGPISFATASATRYNPLAGRASSNLPSTEAFAAMPSPLTGTLRNLHAHVSANSRTTTTTIRTRVAGANGNQTLSIGSTATGLFEDTTNSDSVTQGQLIGLQLVTSTGTQTITIETTGITFENTGRQAYQTSYNQGVANTTASITRYLQIGGDLGTTFGHSTEANAQTKANAGAFKRLGVYVSANARTTTTTVTTRKNGANQAITVSIGSTATGLFEDTTNSFTTAADDLVNHAISFGTGAQSITVNFVSVAFVPALVVAMGQASETDSAQAVLKLKAKVIGQPVELDEAMALATGTVIAVGQAAEIDTAQPVARSKSRTVGQASEADTPHAVTRVKTRAVSQATETDSALALGRSKSWALGIATESSTAQPVARSKSRSIGMPAETDLAQPLAKAKTRILGQATEADTAQPISRAKVIGAATESDLAQAVARIKARTLGQPVETDLAQPVGKSKAKTIGQAAELDVALTFGRAKSRLLGQPLEVDEAQVVTSGMTVLIGLASETDLAQPVGRGKSLTIGQALEADVALALTRVKTGQLGQPAEFDTGQPLTVVRVVTLGSVAEVDCAGPLGRLKSLLLGTAVEVDEAMPVVFVALLTLLRIRTASSEPVGVTRSRIPALATSSTEPSTTGSSRHPALVTSSSRPDLTTEGSEHAT
jgi:hypothetical protein